MSSILLDPVDENIASQLTSLNNFALTSGIPNGDDNK